MKIRNGFVSNSSSSSFIVAFKGKNFLEAYKNSFSNVEFPLKTSIVQDIGNCLERNIDETFTTITDYQNHDDYDEQRKEKYSKLIADGYTVCIGSISDECDYDMIDNYLCHIDIDYKDDNLIIEKEASY